MPLTFKTVSCCPAKEASGKSSAVADDLTAQLTSLPYSASRFSKASSIDFSNSGGNGVFITQFLIFEPTLTSSFTSLTSRRSSASLILSARPSCARNSLYASAVVANPPGTFTFPLLVRFLIISPSDAFFPPTWFTSLIWTSCNPMMYLFIPWPPVDELLTIILIISKLST